MKRVDTWELIQEEYNPFLYDESKLEPEPIERLYFPGNTEEAVEVLAECSRGNLPIVFSGGRTGITGGAVPRGAKAVVSTERLRTVPAVEQDPETGEWSVRTGAGTTLAELLDVLAKRSYTAPDCAQDKQFFFPVDPTETGAALGGMAATNASGARTLRYGPMREWVAGLTVVLADGSAAVLERGRYAGTGAAEGPTRSVSFPVTEPDGRSAVRTVAAAPVAIPRGKHSGGYCLRPPFDAVDLFVGSEGTLGLITELRLRLIEVPPGAAALYVTVFLPEDRPFGLTDRLKHGKTFRPDALEYMDSRSLSLLRDFRREQGEASGVPKMAEGTSGLMYTEIPLGGMDGFSRVYEEIGSILRDCTIPAERTWAGFSPKTLAAMKKLRHALPERINTIIAGRKNQVPGLTKIGTDTAVPDEYLDEMTSYSRERLETEGLEYCIFGHIGNGHLHINILPENLEEIDRAWTVYRELAVKAAGFGGSVSAEHGIGRIKKDFFRLQFSEQDRTAMRRVKETLDPAGLLNPGVLW